jgi:hypothetical protein
MVDLGFIGIMLAFFQLLWGFLLESSKCLFFVRTDQNLRFFHCPNALWSLAGIQELIPQNEQVSGSPVCAADSAHF